MARSKEIQRAARKLNYAIRKFKERGGKIETSTWGVEQDEDDEGNLRWVCEGSQQPQCQRGDVACAMGALIAVYDDVNDINSHEAAAAHILGLRKDGEVKVSDFIYGFDGEQEAWAIHKDWYDLGRKLAGRLSLLEE